MLMITYHPVDEWKVTQSRDLWNELGCVGGVREQRMVVFIVLRIGAWRVNVFGGYFPGVAYMTRSMSCDTETATGRDLH